MGENSLAPYRGSFPINAAMGTALPRDHLKVADVGGPYGITERECRHTDQQVCKWGDHILNVLFSIEFARR